METDEIVRELGSTSEEDSDKSDPKKSPDFADSISKCRSYSTLMSLMKNKLNAMLSQKEVCSEPKKN